MKHSTAMVNELNAAKRLILKHVEVVVDFLMHISGLRKRHKRSGKSRLRFGNLKHGRKGSETFFLKTYGYKPFSLLRKLRITARASLG